VRECWVEIHRAGDVVSKPIVIADETPAGSVVPACLTPAQSSLRPNDVPSPNIRQSERELPPQDYFKGMTAPMRSKTKRSTSEKDGTESSSLGTDTINSSDNIASASDSTASPETHILYDNSSDSNRSPVFNIDSLSESSLASDSTASPKTHILYNNSSDSNISPAFDIDSLSESSPASDSSLESTHLALTPPKPATLEPTTLESKVILASNGTSPCLPPPSGGLGYSIPCTQHLLADNTSSAVDSPPSEYTDSTHIDVAIPSLPPNEPLIPRKFEDMTDFCEDQDALLIIADILANEVRYHRKTADFDDGVCLIKNITKGLDAIKKTGDLMLNMHSNKLKEVFKKQFAGAKTLKVQGSWMEALIYEHIVTTAKNRSAGSYAKTPNVTANYSAAEIEVANEMVRVVSSAENLDTFCKYRRYWKFQHDLRIEYSMTE
jgi:hypothetical protein